MAAHTNTSQLLYIIAKRERERDIKKKKKKKKSQLSKKVHLFTVVVGRVEKSAISDAVF